MLRRISLAVLILQGCVRSDGYRCGSDGECELDGQPRYCEAADLRSALAVDNLGACSGIDLSCASGRRYAELGPIDQRGQCVACGGLWQRCCDDACDDGLSCRGGLCGCTAELAAGNSHTCARKGDGTVWCWGGNSRGELGADRGLTMRADPAPVTGLDRVVELESGGSHSCVRKDDGSVWCWGDNGSGQLGVDTGQSPSATPVRVEIAIPAVEIAAGKHHTCARAADQTVECWGQFAPNRSSISPVPIAPSPPDPIELDAGSRFTCARAGDGGIWCWGSNGANELGDNLPTSFANPWPQRALLDVAAVDLSANASGACIAATDGSVWCWGASGVPGINPFSYDVAQAVLPPDIVAIAHLQRRGCARNRRGELVCWGDTAEPFRWMQLPGPAEGEVAGELHTCAISLGQPWCWGGNGQGQLGDGTLRDRIDPVPAQLSCP